MPADLATIEYKIRQLVRSPSEIDLPQQQIYDNINTFIQYDVPSSLKLFNLHRPFTFYTIPNVADYTTGTTPELADWKNKYPTTNPPVFVSGNRCTWTQSRTQFYNWWQFLNNTNNIATGDGSTQTYTGTITAFPILQGYVNFSALDTSELPMTLVDYPITRVSGALGIPGTPQTLPSPYGDINYLTGDYTVNFPTDVGDGEIVRVQYVPYTSGRPSSILYYNNTFTLRPVPDKVYPVNLEVYVQPTEMIESGQHPELDQWWQYIAYGAAIKILQSRVDNDTVAQLVEEFKRQELMVLRTTIQQQGNNRTATIYSQPLPWSGYSGWGIYGGWPYGWG